MSDGTDLAELRRELADIKVILNRLASIAVAAEELLTVADLRGDSQLPHPEDDPILWTARMQTAWDELRAALGREVQDATLL